jgi:hypothetical protein
MTSKFYAQNGWNGELTALYPSLLTLVDNELLQLGLVFLRELGKVDLWGGVHIRSLWK